MKKKIFVFLLSLIILMGSVAPTLAVATTGDMKVQYLIDEKIVEGRTTSEEGVVDFALDKSITRAEISKLLVHILKLEKTAESIKGSIKAFSDVDNNHWANGYISTLATNSLNIANGRRIIEGYPDGKFLPERDISFNEVSAMLVRIVKDDLTEEMERNAIWATSYMAWAKELGILEDVKYSNSNDPIDRKNAFIMVYNALEIQKKTKKSNPDFRDILGIVSKYQMGVLQINSNKELEYKITENTLFTDGTKATSIFQNAIRPGSLVRVIADENKNATHIIELGNPWDLAIEGRWFGVADKIVNSVDNISFKDNYTESYIINVGGVEAKIDENTKIFAADVKNNVLNEVKAPAQIFEMYKKRRKPIKNVYMGYNTYYTVNEAKVIVFSDVELFQGKEELRRIVMPVDSNLRFSAISQMSGTEKIFSLEDVAHFPSDYNMDYMDVILMKFDSYENAKLKLMPQVLIDYSKDNVYEVVKLEKGLVVVGDMYGNVFPFERTEETALFIENEIKVGSRVQFLFTPPDFIMEIIGPDALKPGNLEDIDFEEIFKNIDLEEALEIIKEIDSINDFNFKAVAISKVDLDLKGALPIGIRSRDERGYIEKISGNTVTVVDKVDGRSVNFRHYQVSATDLKMAQIANKLGFEVIFNKARKFGDTYVIYNIGYYFDYERLYGSPMDDWIYNSFANTIFNKWDKEKLEMAYNSFYGIISGDNAYPVLFRNKEIVIGAVENYNRTNDLLGGPGRIVIPLEYLEGFR